MVKPLPRPTPRQFDLSFDYIEKWRAIATSTDRINRSKVETTLRQIYQMLNLADPVFLLADSPCSAALALKQFLEKHHYPSLHSLKQPFKRHLKEELSLQVTGSPDANVRLLSNTVDKDLHFQLYLQMHLSLASARWTRVWPDSFPTFKTQTWANSDCYIAPEYWAIDGCYLDWLCNCLRCEHDPQLWQRFEALLTECGWIYPFEQICIIADHPTQIHFDAERRLHGEGKPAIAFSDGFSVYAYRGVRLPERYCQLSPQQWPPQWYLDEKESSVRRLMLQELSADKFEPIWLLSEPEQDLQKRLAQKLGIEIQALTESQVAALDVIRQKWRTVARQTTPIHRPKAAEAMRQFYAAHQSAYEPVILFADSPRLGRKLVKQKCRGQALIYNIKSDYDWNRYGEGPMDRFWVAIVTQLSDQVRGQLRKALAVRRSWNLDLDLPRVWVQPEVLSGWLSFLDFCISVLKCVHDAELWAILQSVYTECGWFYPAQRTCVICDRPIQLLVDAQGRLHHEREPAIIYADGYRQRALHGLHPKHYFKTL